MSALRHVCWAASWLFAAGPVLAQQPDGALLATPALLQDLMIQDVCLDAGGKVVIGVAPLPGEPRCASRRDLRPGEPLPYHKHDHSPPEDRDAPNGYQRHDSFPVETAALGVVVEHTFDFGVGGRRFGVFEVGAEGGDVAVLSPGIVSLGATEDPGAGLQIWVGECQGRVTPDALRHAWLIATYDPNRPAPLQGETVARLNRVRRGALETCPARFNGAYTQWSLRPFAFRAGRGQGTPLALATLISDHYGKPGRADANHVERFYFTRELGGTRWERWENRNGNADFSRERVAELAAQIAESGRCSPSEVPLGGAPLVLIDCREWTRIVPPSDPGGDPPGFFIESLRARGEALDLFGKPAGGR